MRNVLEDMQMCCGTTCNKAANISYVHDLQRLVAALTPFAIGAAQAGLDTEGVVEGRLREFVQKYYPEHFE